MRLSESLQKHFPKKITGKTAVRIADVLNVKTLVLEIYRNFGLQKLIE